MLAKGVKGYDRAQFLIKYCIKADKYRRTSLAFEKLQEAMHWAI